MTSTQLHPHGSRYGEALQSVIYAASPNERFVALVNLVAAIRNPVAYEEIPSSMRERLAVLDLLASIERDIRHRDLPRVEEIGTPVDQRGPRHPTFEIGGPYG